MWSLEEGTGMMKNPILHTEASERAAFSGQINPVQFRIAWVEYYFLVLRPDSIELYGEPDRP